MGLIDFPNPASIYESVKTAGLERDIANAFISAAYSAWITAMWRSGSGKWVVFTGEGQALKDAATAMYLSLSELEKKNFLTLTVPQDLMNPDNLSKFVTERTTK